MDYAGIINLALVTLFSSTILAPGLKGIADIKDQISSVDFPIITNTGENADEIRTSITEKGIELNKKLTQYEDKYNETSRFLKYFYFILSIIVSAQILVMYIQGNIFSVTSILFIAALIVIIVVIALVRSYMTNPSVVRSIQWLADKGISNVHTQMLFKPMLVLNSQSVNIISNAEKVSLSIRSSADLNGYGYLLTIESFDSQKVYGLSIGFINNILIKSTISFGTGETGAQTTIFNLKLNPGRYKARLLFFGKVYPGNHAPSETIMDFEVNKKGIAPTKSQPIIPAENKSGIIFTLKNKNNKQKIIHLEAAESFDGSNRISFIFSSTRLLKYLSKGYRPIVFYSRHGDIDRYDLDKYLVSHRVWKRRLYTRFRRPYRAFKHARGHLILLNRNPRSQLESY